MKRKGRYAKRAIDFTASLLALVLLAPLLLAIAAVVRWSFGRGVLFYQVRPGLHGKLFSIVKFRTMHWHVGPDGVVLSDAERLNAVGRFLRHWSLDELPELWNVLKGEMSLVGPRPLLVEYLPRYTAEQQRRHDVLPGITGMAQVMGRNAIPFSQRLAYDLYYVDHWSLWLDLKILLLTALRISSNRLFDGAGQDVRAVDDLGLHPGHETETWRLGRRASRCS